MAYWIIQAFLGARFSVLETSMSLWKFGVLAKNLSEAIFNGYQLTGNGEIVADPATVGAVFPR